MSDKRRDNLRDSIDPLFRPLMDAWARHVDEATRQIEAGVAGVTESEIWQGCFDALARQADDYLRSSSFLDAMKVRIEAICQMMERANDPIANAGLSRLPKQIGELETVTENAEKLPRGNWHAPVARSTARTGVTSHEVVYEDETLRLLRYSSDERRWAEPILICYALINRPYILDLQTGRSVVSQLVAGGFDVYLIDWGVPTEADQKTGFERLRQWATSKRRAVRMREHGGISLESSRLLHGRDVSRHVRGSVSGACRDPCADGDPH